MNHYFVLSTNKELIEELQPLKEAKELKVFTETISQFLLCTDSKSSMKCLEKLKVLFLRIKLKNYSEEAPKILFQTTTTILLKSIQITNQNFGATISLLFLLLRKFPKFTKNPFLKEVKDYFRNLKNKVQEIKSCEKKKCTNKNENTICQKEEKEKEKEKGKEKENLQEKKEKEKVKENEIKDESKSVYSYEVMFLSGILGVQDFRKLLKDQLTIEDLQSIIDVCSKTFSECMKILSIDSVLTVSKQKIIYITLSLLGIIFTQEFDQFTTQLLKKDFQPFKDFVKYILILLSLHFTKSEFSQKVTSIFTITLRFITIHLLDQKQFVQELYSGFFSELKGFKMKHTNQKNDKEEEKEQEKEQEQEQENTKEQDKEQENTKEAKEEHFWDQFVSNEQITFFQKFSSLPMTSRIEIWSSWANSLKPITLNSVIQIKNKAKEISILECLIKLAYQTCSTVLEELLIAPSVIFLRILLARFTKFCKQTKIKGELKERIIKKYSNKILDLIWTNNGNIQKYVSDLTTILENLVKHLKKSQISTVFNDVLRIKPWGPLKARFLQLLLPYFTIKELFELRPNLLTEIFHSFSPKNRSQFINSFLEKFFKKIENNKKIISIEESSKYWLNELIKMLESEDNEDWRAASEVILPSLAKGSKKMFDFAINKVINSNFSKNQICLVFFIKIAKEKFNENPKKKWLNYFSFSTDKITKNIEIDKKDIKNVNNEKKGNNEEKTKEDINEKKKQKAEEEEEEEEEKEKEKEKKDEKEKENENEKEKKNEIKKKEKNGLELALIHSNPEIRTVALELLINSKKPSIPLTELELKLLKKYLIFSLKPPTPIVEKSIRHIIGRKLIIRLQSNLNPKTNKDQSLQTQSMDFLNWLIDYLVSSLYPGSPYCRKKISLILIKMICQQCEIAKKIFLQKKNNILILLNHLVEGWDVTRSEADRFSNQFLKAPFPGYENEKKISQILKWGFSLIDTKRFREADSGALIIKLIYKFYLGNLGWKIKINQIINNNNNNNNKNNNNNNKNDDDDDDGIEYNLIIKKNSNLMGNDNNNNIENKLNYCLKQQMLFYKQFVKILEFRILKIIENPIIMIPKLPLHGILIVLSYLIKETNFNLKLPIDIILEWKNIFDKISNLINKLIEIFFIVLGTHKKSGMLLNEEYDQIDINEDLNNLNIKNDIEEKEKEKEKDNLNQPKVKLDLTVTNCSWLALTETTKLLSSIASQISNIHIINTNKKHENMVKERKEEKEEKEEKKEKEEEKEEKEEEKKKEEQNKRDNEKKQKKKENLNMISPLTNLHLEQFGRIVIKVILNTRHRGVLERGKLHLQEICKRLFSIGSNKPRKWLLKILKELDSYDNTVLRRSGALPPIFLGILRAEITSIIGGSIETLLDLTGKKLLELASINKNNKNDDLDQRMKTIVNSTHVLRSIFQDSILHQHTTNYLFQAIKLCLNNYSSSSWEIKSSASLCFTTLVKKVVFPKSIVRERSRGISWRNLSNRIPQLFPFLLKLMEKHFLQQNQLMKKNNNKNVNVNHDQDQDEDEKNDQIEKEQEKDYSSVIYPILLLFSTLSTNHLKIGSQTNFSLKNAIQLISKSAKSKDYGIRLIASRALAPLISLDNCFSFIENILKKLSKYNDHNDNLMQSQKENNDNLNKKLNFNKIHGLLCQIHSILEVHLNNDNRKKFSTIFQDHISKVSYLLDTNNKCLPIRTLFLEIIYNNFLKNDLLIKETFQIIKLDIVNILNNKIDVYQNSIIGIHDLLKILTKLIVWYMFLNPSLLNSHIKFTNNKILKILIQNNNLTIRLQTLKQLNYYFDKNNKKCINTISNSENSILTLAKINKYLRSLFFTETDVHCLEYLFSISKYFVKNMTQIKPIWEKTIYLINNYSFKGLKNSGLILLGSLFNESIERNTLTSSSTTESKTTTTTKTSLTTTTTSSTESTESNWSPIKDLNIYFKIIKQHAQSCDDDSQRIAAAISLAKSKILGMFNLIQPKILIDLWIIAIKLLQDETDHVREFFIKNLKDLFNNHSALSDRYIIGKSFDLLFKNYNQEEYLFDALFSLIFEIEKEKTTLQMLENDIIPKPEEVFMRGVTNMYSEELFLINNISRILKKFKKSKNNNNNNNNNNSLPIPEHWRQFFKQKVQFICRFLEKSAKFDFYQWFEIETFIPQFFIYIYKIIDIGYSLQLLSIDSVSRKIHPLLIQLIEKNQLKK
ncbi:thyroid adenoma-associated protein [Anaeramoeba flamelloides]|uniref:Thyroid adenoma-associated protein n=1 Tax=Anaeramoeba flamelloides TaxID=1746091 RepID=A0ABQ8YEB4_9EUKA|nr:thyroid adenoma-associated protein [Anaeramoeba flamelloides]